MNAEWCQATTNPKTKPDDLGCKSSCAGCQSLHPLSPFIIITHPESRYSFYRPTWCQWQWQCHWQAGALLRQSSTDWCSGIVVIVPRRMIPLLRGQRQAHSPSAGTVVSDAVTSELGDRQSSHPVKNPASILWQVLEALPGVAYPGFRDNRSTLNTKTGYIKKKPTKWIYSTLSNYCQCLPKHRTTIASALRVNSHNVNLAVQHIR